MKPRLMKRFYEVLVLLRVLGQVQGERIPPQLVEDCNLYDFQTIERRRKVMYYLCIVCDFEKGGDTVTAIATESVPNGPRYWVAANGYLSKIELFLVAVLKKLEKQGLDSIESSVFEEQLFELTVSFHRPRIKKYWKLLQPCINNEIKRIQLSSQGLAKAGEYEKWLHSLKDSVEDIKDFYKLSQLSYDTRHSKFLRADYDPISDSSTAMENDSRITIRHCVGRLGAVRRAASLLTSAATNYPELFDGFSVQALSSGFTSARPIPQSNLTLSNVAGRMFPNGSTDLQRFRETLLRLDSQGSIMDRILDQYRDKNWKPRVHAELQLLEALNENDCAFYEGDRYIACSKAACFCCYHYICEHPNSFSRPPSHNKVYLNWWPPTLNAGSESKIQQDVMNAIVRHVRQAVVEKVLNTIRANKWHPDSSTGITPLVQQEIEIAETPDPEERQPLYKATSDSGDDSEDGGVSVL